MAPLPKLPLSQADISEIAHVLDYLDGIGVSLTQFFIAILELDFFQQHPALSKLQLEIPFLLDTFSEHPFLVVALSGWSFQHVVVQFAKEISEISCKENGWHFNAFQARAEALEDFNVSCMAEAMNEKAPLLWTAVRTLLHGGTEVIRTTDILGTSAECAPKSVFSEENVSSQKSKIDQSMHHLNVKAVAIISMLAKSVNQKCNAFAAVIGMFLHSCVAPTKAIEMLARVGLSISVNSINDTVTSLSKEATKSIQAAGQTLRAAYAYDNIDVVLPHKVPTVENTADSMEHLTTGTIVLLHPDAKVEDMRCSQYLWERSPLNNQADKSKFPQYSITKLMELYPDIPDENGMYRRDRFNEILFQEALCIFGPEPFRAHRPRIAKAETVEEIPLTDPTKQVPLFTSKANNSTNQGNIDMMQGAVTQGGVVNKIGRQHLTRIDDMVVFFHGDLGTGTRIHAVKARRAVEATPFNRLQFGEFLPGQLHFKMACADTMRRIFFEKAKGKDADPSSCSEYASILRPNETGKIASDPGYRRTHELITHIGVVERLECWRIEVQKRFGHETLEMYAATNPPWESIVELSKELALKYASGEHERELREKPERKHDQQEINAYMRVRLSCLYEETSRSINCGDIGRLDTCTVAWIVLFKATGKHKYAHHMMKFLTDVHFVYPEGLKRAARYSLLCNPTGHRDTFRPVDWLVEFNNLFIKAVYGGGGSNHTIERIIAESALIEVYRGCIKNIEKNFDIMPRSKRHGTPDMTKTFASLSRHMRKNSPFIHESGRKSSMGLPDFWEMGFAALETLTLSEIHDSIVNFVDGEIELEPGVDDILGELYD